MRDLATADRIHRFMRSLGGQAIAPARVYFTGGATAVLLGWRESTIDVDIKLVPDQDALLRAIASLKDTLSINIELAAPDDFVPVPAGWETRSPFVSKEGPIAFHHFDFYAQALSKLERGHAQDLEDVHAMLDRGLIERPKLWASFEAIRPQLYRYPAVDPASFDQAVRRLVD